MQSINVKKYNSIKILIFLVAGIITISGCKGKNALPVAGKALDVSATKSVITPALVQSNQSPIAVSPVQISPLTTPTRVIPHSTVNAPAKMIDFDTDIQEIVLNAEDMADLFQASYNIVQPYNEPGMKGIEVVYPTKAIEHTSAFAEGFGTKVEIYKVFDEAVARYDRLVFEQTGDSFDMTGIGNLAEGFVRAETETGSMLQRAIILDKNAVIIITIKTAQPLQLDILKEKPKIVIDRLN